jgi:serine/threonine protein kinase
MTALGFAEFLQGLQDCKALNGDQLQLALEYAQHGPPDPRHLGRELLRRGWMTAYQINQIHRGQAHALTLGPYLLLERLGHGGMGEVLKARHMRMGRLVALKIVRADRLAKARAVPRFEREVQTVARLDHLNIVHAYDAGVLDDALYLAMEYLEGTDLKRLVRTRGPLPAATACDYARQAAEGLQHASERGVVHRDVKPSNLFLTARGGTIKLLDLGLARLLEEEANLLTRPGVPLGTASYQAPEQILDAGAADVRSDLYGLGCTLHFLLTGRPPFMEGNAVHRMLAHLREEPRPVESLRKDLPTGLGPLLRKLMAKRPADRYQSPSELVEGLTGLLQGAGVPRGGAGSETVR